MASITKLAVNLAYHGAEAEAGLERTSKAMRDTGIAALDAANKFSQLNQDKIKSGGLDKDQIRSLTKLSELDQERAIDRMSEENALRKMSKSSQLLYEQMIAGEKARSKAAEDAAAESARSAKATEASATSAAAKVKADADARALQISKLSKLDQQRLFDKEKREAAILAMTPKQQVIFEKAEKAKLKAAQEADRLAGLSFTGRIKESLKGMQDVKATLEMIRGISLLALAGPKMLVNALSHMVELGAKLQTTQIRMGVLAGSFDQGAASLERLRQTSRDFGGPLDELVAGFTALKNNGINNDDSTALLRTFSSIGGVLGEGGVGALAASVGTMARSGVADLGGLKRMADSGLNVFEELGKRIGSTAKDAEEMVSRGAVNAVTAVHAMQAAANSPEANAAKKLFEASLDGQLSRLKVSLTELMADIGLDLITNLNLAGIVNVLRGALEGVQLIVKSISDILKGLSKPGASLEDNFKSARDFTITIAEVFSRIGIDFAKVVNSVAKIVNGVVDMKAALEQAGNEQKFSDNQITRKQFNQNLNTIMSRQRDNTVSIINIADMQEGVDTFFKKVKDSAAALDAQRALDKLAPAPLGAPVGGLAGAGGQKNPMPEPVVRDAFSALRDLQLLGGNATNQVRTDALAAIEAMRGKFNQGASDNFAARVDANTAAAQEAILRNRGGGEANAVDQLRELIELTKRDMATTQQKQDQLIDAVRNNKLVIPAQKL